jgi:ABC-2 type transport system ATP-binding protein
MDEAESLCEQIAILHHGRLVAIGSPAELEAAVGAEATMDDVFVKFTGGSIDERGGYRDVARSRRTTERLR